MLSVCELIGREGDMTGVVEVDVVLGLRVAREVDAGVRRHCSSMAEEEK